MQPRYHLSCAKVLNVVNCEKINWREELYDNIRMKMITLYQALYKERTYITKTMVGPHVTIMLAAQQHMTVKQENKAGIWDPLKILENDGP